MESYQTRGNPYMDHAPDFNQHQSILSIQKNGIEFLTFAKGYSSDTTLSPLFLFPGHTTKQAATYRGC